MLGKLYLFGKYKGWYRILVHATNAGYFCFYYICQLPETLVPARQISLLRILR
jgi:hypothetical protein